VALPPSGRQFRIQSGRRVADAVELGAGLREYVVAGRRVLDGYPVEAAVAGSRGVPLLPWPNRIEDGRYAFGGDELQVPINRVDEQTAIHGLTRWVPWTPIEHVRSRVVFGTVIYPQPGYPFTLALRVTYEVSSEGLVVEITARNEGDRALPYGAGHHPYLAVPGGHIDSARLRVPAGRALLTGPRGLPIGELDVAGTPYDFSRARPIGDLKLNTCYFELERDPDRRARVGLEGTTLWVDETYPYLMLFSGEDLPDPAEHRRSLAVEPMTCPPNAFRTGTALIVLRPGESIAGRWGIEA
jgi:aldose 1-epimerase